MFSQGRLRNALEGAIAVMRFFSSLPNAQQHLSFPYALFLLGAPRSFMHYLMTQPSPYALSTLIGIWQPTEEARKVRTHKDFPAFAEKMGLVRIWQKQGWPEFIQPLPGTDGSNLQFSCR